MQLFIYQMLPVAPSIFSSSDTARTCNLIEEVNWSCFSRMESNHFQHLFSAHSWTKDTPRGTNELYRQDILSCEQLEVGGYSFSNLNISRDQDLSFRDGSPLVVSSEREDSPVFSCHSSFFSSPVNQRTPSSVTGDVNSGNCCKSHEPEFSSPISSMPSFTFFTPMPAFEPSEESLSFKTRVLSVDGGTLSSLLERHYFSA